MALSQTFFLTFLLKFWDRDHRRDLPRICYKNTLKHILKWESKYKTIQAYIYSEPALQNNKDLLPHSN